MLRLLRCYGVVRFAASICTGSETFGTSVEPRSRLRLTADGPTLALPSHPVTVGKTLTPAIVGPKVFGLSVLLVQWRDGRALRQVAWVERRTRFVGLTSERREAPPLRLRGGVWFVAAFHVGFEDFFHLVRDVFVEGFTHFPHELAHFCGTVWVAH